MALLTPTEFFEATDQLSNIWDTHTLSRSKNTANNTPAANSVAGSPPRTPVVTSARKDILEPSPYGNIILNRPEAYKPNVTVPGYRAMTPIFSFPTSLASSTDVPFMHIAVTEPQANAHRVKFALALYMPPTLKVSYGQEYETVELGLAQDIMNLVATGTTKVGGLLKEMGINSSRFQQTLKSVAEATGGYKIPEGESGNQVKNIGLRIGARVADTILPGNLGSLLQVKNRIAVNPHVAVAYRGPHLRTFDFDFVFCPKNREESMELDNILFQLKAASCPELQEQNAATSQYFNYPDNFIINLYAPGNPPKFLFRMAPLVMTDLTIDYAGSGHVAFFDATSDPVQVNVSMRFLETAVVTRKEIKRWF